MARDDGFTLLEVLVALTILVLVLTVVVGRLGAAVDTLSRVDGNRAAASMALGIMTELGHSRPLAYGLSEGNAANGLHWRLLIAPTLDRPPGAALPRLEAHNVALTISWHVRTGIRQAAFNTIRLGLER